MQRFFLHCHSASSRYLLTAEDQPEQKEFKCLLGALLHIAALVQERTPVTLFDEFGVAFEERIVIPNAEAGVPGENRTRI